MRKLRFHLIFFIVFITPHFLSYSMGNIEEPRGMIKGQVYTSDDKVASFVTVQLTSANKMTSADENGQFIFKNVAPGDHELEISLIGYQTSKTRVSVSDGQTTAVAIKLELLHAELEAVVIQYLKNSYKANRISPSLRLTTPILELPQNIQVVTGSVLSDQQVISMSDGVIRNVSGLVRAEHWGDLYTNITARGSQIQALRNGMNVTNSHWGPLTEDMSFVSHIEFVKGPAGFMMAGGDPSGFYNVVTKKPTGHSNGEVTLTLGSYNLYRTAVDFDGKLSDDGRLLYRVNLSAQNKNSHRPNEYNNRYVVAPVISYQLDEKTLLTAEYSFQKAVMSNVGSFYVFSPDGFVSLPRDFTSLPAGTPGTKINDHSFYFNLQHQFNSNWKITAQLAHFRYDQEGASMWPTSVNPDGTLIRNIGIWDANSVMNMGQVFLNGEFKTRSLNHKVLIGLDISKKDYLADWNQSHDLDLPGSEFDPRSPNHGTPPNGYPDFDRSKSLEERAYAAGSFQLQQASSVYLQDEISLMSNKLRLTIAGRYTHLIQEYYGADSAVHFTPRVGLSYSIDKETSVYGLYDQAFIPQSGALSNGGKVQPITGNNIEVGIKKEWLGGKLRTTLTAYRIIKNNELTDDPFDPNPAISIELGQKRSQGIEFDLNGRVTDGLRLILNYAYTGSRITKVTKGITDIEEGDM
ncbi:MAG TPA: TonB-dependent siderophore receptor, partial [Parasegetibacter sp.]